jgi:hypothetical protein
MHIKKIFQKGITYSGSIYEEHYIIAVFKTSEGYILCCYDLNFNQIFKIESEKYISAPYKVDGKYYLGNNGFFQINLSDGQLTKFDIPESEFGWCNENYCIQRLGRSATDPIRYYNVKKRKKMDRIWCISTI